MKTGRPVLFFQSANKRVSSLPKEHVKKEPSGRQHFFTNYENVLLTILEVELDETLPSLPSALWGDLNAVKDLICWVLDGDRFLWDLRAVPLVSQPCYIIHIVEGIKTMKHDTMTAGQKEKKRVVTSYRLKICLTRRTNRRRIYFSLKLLTDHTD